MQPRTLHRLRAGAVASAVACVVCIIYWLRGLGDHVDVAQFGDPPHHIIMSHGGSIVLHSLSPPGDLAGDATGFSGGSFLGFASYTTTYPKGSVYSLQVPYWFLVLATAVLPVWYLWRVRKARTPDRGFEIAGPEQPTSTTIDRAQEMPRPDSPSRANAPPGR